MKLRYLLPLMAAALPLSAVAQTIYPIDRATMMSDGKFDFKVEFGVDKDGTILLSDEISPDSCRFWDMDTNEKLDKDRFRQSLGDVIEGYEEVAQRIGVPMPE